MIKIEKSLCHCGKCSARFEVEWDVDYISSYERSMGAMWSIYRQLKVRRVCLVL